MLPQYARCLLELTWPGGRGIAGIANPGYRWLAAPEQRTGGLGQSDEQEGAHHHSLCRHGRRGCPEHPGLVHRSCQGEHPPFQLPLRWVHPAPARSGSESALTFSSSHTHTCTQHNSKDFHSRLPTLGASGDVIPTIGNVASSLCYAILEKKSTAHLLRVVVCHNQWPSMLKLPRAGPSTSPRI